MPNIIEADQQQPGGSDGATLLPPQTALSAPLLRIEPPAGPAWVSDAARNLRHGAKRILPDSLFLSLFHKRKVGRFPNLRNPKTFNEFILHRCLHPDPQWSLLADKLAVREFVKERIGEEYLIPLVAVPDVFTEDVFDALPDAFVMKTNHGSGYVKIVRDKRQTSFEALSRLAQKWLAQDYYRASRERHYRPIKPKLYFEALLLERTGDIPPDLKMNMFGRDAAGPIIYTGIVSDRFGIPHADLFDARWNHLDVGVGHYPRSKLPPPPPPHWDEIVGLAMRLAEGLGYVRVDLYVPDGKVFFGELTFTPGAGVFPFHPDRHDYEWGRLFENMIEERRRAVGNGLKNGGKR